VKRDEIPEGYCLAAEDLYIARNPSASRSEIRQRYRNYMRELAATRQVLHTEIRRSAARDLVIALLAGALCAVAAVWWLL
jgi:hypothetical protein